MSIDLHQSRRTYNIEVQYWYRNENEDFQGETGINTQNSLIHNRVPNGLFYAKIVNNIAKEENNAGGVFMYDKTTITLKTPDNTQKLKANDVVKLQGELYFVDRVEKQPSKVQQTEYMNINSLSYFTYISIRK